MNMNFIFANIATTVGVKRGFEERIPRTFEIKRHREPKKEVEDADNGPGQQQQQQTTLPLPDMARRASQVNDNNPSQPQQQTTFSLSATNQNPETTPNLPSRSP